MAYQAKFTERGQRALLAAQKEAAQLGRTYVGTEHLLLGVLTEPGGARAVLRGITLDMARDEIIQIANVFRSSIIDLTPTTLTVSVIGDETKTAAVQELLQEFGILELVRTGIVAIERGANTINEKTSQ